MQEQERIDNVVVKVKDREKSENYCVDIQISENGEIDVLTLTAVLESLKAYGENQILLYFDNVSLTYVRISDEHPQVHADCLIKENLIQLKVESIFSDQLLANPVVKGSEKRPKRNREKTIQEAFSVTQQWRSLYREGTYDEKGNLVKMNLDQASEMIAVPRKTLEDFYLLLRKAKNLGFKFRDHSQSKVGVLRSFIREKSQLLEEKKQLFDEKKFFKGLQTQLTDSELMKHEQELFDVIEQHNSDQDILFQN